ncbi:hypothetical protein KJY78_04670 [Canibacter sp. lx-45]|uniref:hypothetical protein n=1 Tax=Canibacter zhuwentaonis TaxID=2837491 RepID=UPI001BDBD3D8|nr:hypothetical protein [Canibacter zhuwentaonis]MBT1035644.1 hypothetical protein [Canibacter zhuwentaonis]
MEILRNIILILHFLCFGALLGTTIAQFKPAKNGSAVISGGMLHSAIGLLLTGAGLVGIIYATGGEPNNLKIGVKLAVLLVIVGLIVFFRKKENVSTVVLGAMSSLLVLNVTLEVIW